MKRLALAILPALILYTSPAQAWWGGPWSNNSPTNSTGAGTFQGVLTGPNVTGVMIFGYSSTSSSSAATQTTTQSFNFFTGSSTTSTSVTSNTGMGTTGSEGRAAIFVDGFVVVADLSAIVNLPGKTISGIIEGSQVRSVSSMTDNEVANSTTTAATNTSTVNYTTTHYQFTDVENVTGDFNATLDQTSPDVTFAGTGTLTVKHPNDGMGVVPVTIPIADQGTVSANSVDSGGYFTTFVVNFDDPVQIPIVVNGVKTSDSAPTFGNAIQVQQSSVAETATF